MCAFVGWWLVFGLLSWIRSRSRRTALQQPRLLCPWGNRIGGRAGGGWQSNSSHQWERGCAGEGQMQRQEGGLFSSIHAFFHQGIGSTHSYSRHHFGWKSHRHSFCPLPNYVYAPSHSSATISSVLCKRKAIALDTFATSSSSLCLIENVDMGELIEDLVETKVPPPAYRRIQDFLTKVCVLFHCFLHSFHEVHHLFFSLIFFAFFLLRLEQAVLVQTPSLRFTRTLIYSLQICPRTCMCLTFRSHPRMFLFGTSHLPPTLRFWMPSQMPRDIYECLWMCYVEHLWMCHGSMIHIQRSTLEYLRW